jgi:hypothetical protein
LGRNQASHVESTVEVYSGEAALECGGSRRRFSLNSQQSFIYITITKERYRMLLPLLPNSRMGHNRKAVAAATALQGASRTVGRDSSLNGGTPTPYIPQNACSRNTNGRLCFTEAIGHGAAPLFTFAVCLLRFAF